MKSLRAQSFNSLFLVIILAAVALIGGYLIYNNGSTFVANALSRLQAATSHDYVPVFSWSNPYITIYINSTSSNPTNATIKFEVYNTGYNPIELSNWALYFYDASDDLLCYQNFYLSNNDKVNLGVSEYAFSSSLNKSLSWGQFLPAGDYASFNITLYPKSQCLKQIYEYINRESNGFYVQLEIYPTRSVTEELYCQPTSGGNEFICTTNPVINP